MNLTFWRKRTSPVLADETDSKFGAMDIKTVNRAQKRAKLSRYCFINSNHNLGTARRAEGIKTNRSRAKTNPRSR